MNVFIRDPGACDLAEPVLGMDAKKPREPAVFCLLYNSKIREAADAAVSHYDREYDNNDNEINTAYYQPRYWKPSLGASPAAWYRNANDGENQP